MKMFVKCTFGDVEVSGESTKMPEILDFISNFRAELATQGIPAATATQSGLPMETQVAPAPPLAANAPTEIPPAAPPTVPPPVDPAAEALAAQQVAQQQAAAVPPAAPPVAPAAPPVAPAAPPVAPAVPVDVRDAILEDLAGQTVTQIIEQVPQAQLRQPQIRAAAKALYGQHITPQNFSHYFQGNTLETLAKTPNFDPLVASLAGEVSKLAHV